MAEKKRKEKISARSIFDVEKYISCMKDRQSALKTIITQYFYRNTGMEEVVYHEYIDKFEDLSYKITILESELKIAKMSNVIKIDDNDMSIDQAENLNQSLIQRNALYDLLMTKFGDGHSLATAAHFTYESLVNKISEINKRIYVNKKIIDNACIETMIELNVEDFDF